VEVVKVSNKRQVYHTNIWEEEAEEDNPFATKTAYCHGYDVYGEILQKASWFEYLYLMFKGERPTAEQAALLEKLAIALANPGPREASVRAAMNGGVSKAAHASSLMAALAVGAGQYGGSHEVYILMDLWQESGLDLEIWTNKLLEPADDSQADIWLPMEHSPGFDPNGESCPTFVLQTLEVLTSVSPGKSLRWLKANREALEEKVGSPLAMSGVIAAAFNDLEMNNHQASMLYLMLRLPGAAAHAIEQRDVGWKNFPFFSNAIEITNDPGDKGLPTIDGVNL
jgi:citrate synthase